LDIFAGSNTTGQVAELLKRQWLSFELSREYVGASAFRFLTNQNTLAEMREVFDVIVSGKSVDLTQFAVQRMLATGD
jgi:site-specific DNA-methyltransferase (cytosine-N4-specific)